MANNKDFKVKKGLVVTENILAQGNIQLVDSLGNTLTLVDSSNNVIVAGSIIGPSTLTIDPAAVGDATGLVRILGNLTVEGTTTSINSTTLDVSDKNITIAKNAADAAAANGAGLTIDGASATLTYASTGDKFVFNKSVEASSFVGSVTGNIVGNVTGNVTGTVSDISNHSTSNLSEGTNLYYTTTRSDSDFDASFALASTDSLSEGSTNLYHTTARVRSSISGDKGISYNSSTGVIDVDSTNITSIARGAVSASGALTYNAANGQFSFISGQSGLIDSSLAQGIIDSNLSNTINHNLILDSSKEFKILGGVSADSSKNVVLSSSTDNSYERYQAVAQGFNAGLGVYRDGSTGGYSFNAPAIRVLNATELSKFTAAFTAGEKIYILKASAGGDLSQIENPNGITWDAGGTSGSNRIHITPSASFSAAYNNAVIYQRVGAADANLRIAANDDSASIIFAKDLEIRQDGQLGLSQKLTLNANTVELQHNSSKKFETTSTGVTVTGTVTATAFSGDGSNLTNLPSGQGLLGDVVDDTTPQLGGNLDLNSKNITGTGGIQISGNIELPDNYEVRFGTSQDLTLAHFSGNSEIRNRTGELQVRADTVKLKNNNNNATYLSGVNGGAVELYHNNIKKIETTASGVDVTGNIVVSGTVDGIDIAALNTTVGTKIANVVEDTTPQLGGNLDVNGNDINFSDNSKANFGAGNDLQIYHDGNNSYIEDAGTGDLIITTPASNILRVRSDDMMMNNAANNAHVLRARHANGVELYYSGSQKFVTTNTGVTVTGTATATAFSGPLTGNVTGQVSDISNHSTSNLSEGTNLYYTKVRVDSDISEFAGDSINFGSNVSIAGNLTVSGTQTVVNTTTLDVTDLNITVAKGAANAAAANGAGLTVDGASATLLYQNTGDKWVFNKPLEATSFTGNFTSSSVDINGGAIDGTNIGATTPGTGAFTTLTGNTVGGFSHLSAVGGGGTVDIVVTVASKTAAHRYNGTGSGNGYVLDGVQAPYLTLTPGRTYKFKQDDNSNSGHPFRFYYDAAKTTAYTTNVTTQGSGGSTGDYTQIVVDENTPPVLFYQCSAHGYMGNAVRMGTRNFTGLTSDNLTEGSTNLYYTNARVDTRFDTRLATKSTTNLTEGTNLYFTNARADARIQAANLSDLNNVTGVPSTGQILSWNGSNWVPADDAGGLDSALTKQLIDSAHIGKINLGDLNNVSSAAPSSGQVLKWNGSAWAPAADATGGGGGGGSQNLFSTIAVAGQSDVVADATTDTLTLVAGSNMTITTNAGSDTITFASTGGGGGSGTVDSAATITLIQSTVDSAYVQLRQTSGGGGGSGTVDSAATISLINAHSLDSGRATSLIDSDYVQARMLGINSSKITEFKYLADSGQTVFSGNDANGNALAISSTNHEVYLNGIRLLSSDFVADASANRITVSQGLDSADELVVVTQGSLTTNDRFVIGAGTQRFFFSADSGQTAFTGNDKHGNALTFDSGQVDVYLNGILLTNEDVIQNGTTNTITLTSAADSDDDLAIIAYNATLAAEFTAGTGTLNTFKYTLNAAQTIITGADIRGNSLAYIPGNQQVFLNGLLLEDSDDYVTTSTGSITLTSGANANDEIVIQDFASKFSGNVAGIINPEFKEFKYIADSGDTVFSGNDASGQALSLTSNNFEVFLNGIRLLKSDYVANTTANSITLQGFTAADSDEIIINTIVGNVRFNSASSVASIVDSAYVNARVAAGTDSASVINLINSTVDEAYITRHSLDSSLALQLLLDSSEIIDLIDSAYINARVSTVDSAQVLGIVDSAYIQTAADSAHVQSKIPHAYIQARVPASYIQANQTNFLDSALTSQLVDSAYVAARTTTGTDSAAVIAMIDSDHINSRLGIFSVSPITTEFLYTVDSGATIISGNDNSGKGLVIDSNNFEVFLNGIRLQSTDYVDSAADNRITLNNHLDSGDEISIVTTTQQNTLTGVGVLPGIVDSAYIQARLSQIVPASTAFSTFRYVSTEGQSVYTGNDANGAALSYDSAGVQVFLNGLLLTKTQDFTLQNKNQITLQDSVNAGSEIIINNHNTSFRGTQFSGVAAVVDSAYVAARQLPAVTYNATSSNITLVKGNAYIVDTSSARTLTLPASAVLGDEIKVIDGTGQANTNNITINRNGHKIQGLTDNLVINVNRAAQGLVYYNAAQGWILSEN